jgi:hypothetical protein
MPIPGQLVAAHYLQILFTINQQPKNRNPACLRQKRSYKGWTAGHAHGAIRAFASLDECRQRKVED